MIAEATPASDAPMKTAETLKALAKPLADVGAQMIALSQSVAGNGGTETQPSPSRFKEKDPTLPPTLSGFISKMSLVGGLFDGDPKADQGGDGKEGSDPSDKSDAAKSAEKINNMASENATKQAEADKTTAESDKKMWAEKLGNAVAGFGKLAKVRKKYAIAAALINVATGITETFKQHGFPFAIPFAAALAAQGAQQIAAIKGQAHGGLDRIPSTGTYLLEKGERVVGKRLNDDLTGFLRATSAAATNTSIDRSQVSTSHFNPTINMRFDGGSDQMAVSDNRSQVERMIREIYADYAQAAPFGA